MTDTPTSGTARASTKGPGQGSRVRFPLTRWLLAPRTTWRARRLAANCGMGMDARTAWVLARLQRHPEERGSAIQHLGPRG
ncbi:hypothetical protein [Streptomyces sp. AA1529]|uniref:hypothetical protein n=1 Tax=Streptomyces sp. AA1529 TaxID=1203257 RepID=UPI001ED8D1C5|nr:hypothetical protein [Streptomyces sp. AA1529]